MDRTKAFGTGVVTPANAFLDHDEGIDHFNSALRGARVISGHQNFVTVILPLRTRRTVRHAIRVGGIGQKFFWEVRHDDRRPFRA
jgi:hypothetical protein